MIHVRGLAVLLALPLGGCGAIKTQLVEPPSEHWEAIDVPLKDTRPDDLYHAMLQVLAERDLRPAELHDGARLVVTGWQSSPPPVLYAWKENDDPPKVGDTDRATIGEREVALVVTVQAATARVDLLCREKLPVVPGVLPPFGPCSADTRPPDAAGVAREVMRVALRRAEALATPAHEPDPLP